MAQFEPGPVVLKGTVVTCVCLAAFAVVRCQTNPVDPDRQGPKPAAEAPAPETAEWRIRMKASIARNLGNGRLSLVQTAA
jgi:hypothetical protein